MGPVVGTIAADLEAGVDAAASTVGGGCPCACGPRVVLAAQRHILRRRVQGGPGLTGRVRSQWGLRVSGSREWAGRGTGRSEGVAESEGGTGCGSSTRRV